MKKDLSIIILSYNTSSITKKCIDSLLLSLQKVPKINSEVIVLDNASSDNSIAMLKNYQKKISGQNKSYPKKNNELNKKKYLENIVFKTIFSKKNLGFSKGNNVALKRANGKYVLFLNSDAIIKNIDFYELIEYFEKNPDIGALTVKLVFQNGDIDPASHRGFPTLWRSFTYFTKLEKLFGKIPFINKYFGGYHLTYLDLNKTHEIDSLSGAFFLTRKSILNKLKGFDEKFFMYGEDLDLSYRIKKLGYKIIYYPKFTVLHLKYQSGLKRNDNNKNIKEKTNIAFFDAMKIFYNKHFAKNYPSWVNKLVYFIIQMKKESKI